MKRFCPVVVALEFFPDTKGVAATVTPVTPLCATNQKTFRYFFVAFSWFFRGPLLSRKTVFGPFSLLFRGFFVAFSWLFSWPPFWANFTRTRPGTVF